jgi:hypothetical protein
MLSCSVPKAKLLTFLPSLDVDALSVLSAPHKFRRWEAVRFARERDVLIFSNRHRRLRAVAIQYIGRHCNNVAMNVKLL